MVPSIGRIPGGGGKRKGAGRRRWEGKRQDERGTNEEKVKTTETGLSAKSKESEDRRRTMCTPRTGADRDDAERPVS